VTRTAFLLMVFFFYFNNISVEETNSGRTDLRKFHKFFYTVTGSAVGAIFLRARFFFSLQANFNVRFPEAWLQARIFARDSQELIFYFGQATVFHGLINARYCRYSDMSS